MHRCIIILQLVKLSIYIVVPQLACIEISKNYLLDIQYYITKSLYKMPLDTFPKYFLSILLFLHYIFSHLSNFIFFSQYHFSFVTFSYIYRILSFLYISLFFRYIFLHLSNFMFSLYISYNLNLSFFIFLSIYIL
jgi:hypothetical protein